MSAWLNNKLNGGVFHYDYEYEDTKRFGVEIEFEGVGITANQKQIDPNVWKTLADGSLRGESFEVVMRHPMGLSEAGIAVKALYARITAGGAKINDSMRAGLHVHLNCQNITLKRLYTFMAAYYCIEDMLVDYLGEERAGNLFCLRLSDAEDISFAIANSLKRESLGGIGYFTNENLRYSAMNLVSLSKFGTLEFRAMRTPTTAEPVIEWLKILDHLYLGSKKFEDPAALISAMSANGEKEVLSVLLPEDFAKKLFKRSDFEDSLYKAIRNIQHWVFRTNWSTK